MDAKIKHLEMILAIINRMSNNSFLLKGWTVTVISALLAVFIKNQGAYILAIFPVIMLWWLDAFFLRQEKLYRNLYKKVALTDSKNIDFLMNTSLVSKKTDSWFKIFFSKTLFIFYGAIIGTILLCSTFLKKHLLLWGIC
ncbi:hypothetical protein [Sporomusa aerivorans]|uniref:hypothetical protein n=1 Tax=Sporomusa aerivorans TaxID=204936 RepID=UPI00352A5C32